MKYYLRVCRLAAAVALAAATVAPVALAQGACKPFSVKNDMTHRSVKYIDLGEEGHGPGDLRVGYMPLIDESGNTVGRHRWRLTVYDALPSADAGGDAVSDSLATETLVFDDGMIFILSLPTAVRQGRKTERQSVKGYTGAVVGGTGTYAFARGTVEVNFDGDDSTISLDIRCD